MKYFSKIICLTAILAISCISQGQRKTAVKTKSAIVNAGLKLPTGFNASIIARDLGAARHLAVNSEGDIYVKLDR